MAVRALECGVDTDRESAERYERERKEAHERAESEREAERELADLRRAEERERHEGLLSGILHVNGLPSVPMPLRGTSRITSARP